MVAHPVYSIRFHKRLKIRWPRAELILSQQLFSTVRSIVKICFIYILDAPCLFNVTSKKRLLIVLITHADLSPDISSLMIPSPVTAHLTQSLFASNTRRTAGDSLGSEISHQYKTSGGKHLHSTSSSVYSRNHFSTHLCRDFTTIFIASWRTLIISSLLSKSAVNRSPLSNSTFINDANPCTKSFSFSAPFFSRNGFRVQNTGKNLTSVRWLNTNLCLFLTYTFERTAWKDYGTNDKLLSVVAVLSVLSWIKRTKDYAVLSKFSGQTSPLAKKLSAFLSLSRNMFKCHL